MIRLNHPPDTPPRYVVGIDLGTTNCAVSFVDTQGQGRTISDFPIPQFTAPDVTESRDTLPSFLYALTADETTAADQRIDPSYRIGTHARDHGALTPGRLIASAKSWLCHAGVDRKAAILPWHAAPDVKSISPVEAQSLLLRHIRTAWDDAHPGHLLAEQEVYITVPASFDEVARELTVEAARKAGYPALILIEEPQAAFYAWLSHHETSWPEIILPDDHILVCDVGGGTTDLTLIHARPGDGGPVVFHRTAVGDHLILGGDNLDLALAHHLEEKLSAGQKLDPRSWTTLVRLCRHYKEFLLSENAPDSVDVVLPGAGAGILRNQRIATLTRTEAEQVLLNGFMPMVEWSSSPAKRSSGFQEFGLPFAADPAISKYLAEFLRANLPKDSAGQPIPPRAILLNGGLFESPVMRRRFYEVLSAWFDGMTDLPWKPALLDHRRLDLAVARGAAYFGLARRGAGVKVVSNLARTYYLGIESPDGESMAVCIAPASLSTGRQLTVDQHPFTLKLKTPVEFPLYVSSRRTTDPAGAMVSIDAESFIALPPVRTVMTAGKQAVQSTVSVNLTALLTELGTLDLAVVEREGNRSWKLAFDLRAATRTDLSFHDAAGERTGLIDDETIQQAASAVRAYFQRSQSGIGELSIMKELEVIIGANRIEWPVSVLRALWQSMMDSADTRRISAQHEQRWLNLTGYFLRPGFGFALDDWRIAETWKIFPAGIIHKSNEAVNAEWWILWRRLAGGLTTGQQTALGLPLVAALKSLFQGKPRGRISNGWEIRFGSHEIIEVLRLISLLERIDRGQRELLGGWMLDRIIEKSASAEKGACLWALGHLGARTPLYGPIHQVISVDIVTRWIRQLGEDSVRGKELPFTLMLLARRTGDRYRDIDESTRDLVIRKMQALNSPAHWISLVEQGGDLDRDDQGQIFGETLPRGLRLTP